MRNSYAVEINRELINAVLNAPVLEPKDLYVEKALELLFANYDWSKSFSVTQTILYDDLLTSEILIILHKWVRKKCADIENIQICTTHNLGISDWWKKWCDVNHVKSFKIKELFYAESRHFEVVNCFFSPMLKAVDDNFYKRNKQICRLFSFYGNGRPVAEDRFPEAYSTLKMLQLVDDAEIDFLGKFPKKQDLIDYVEHITYYKNQKDIDYISLTYDKHVKHQSFQSSSCLNLDLPKIQSELLDFGGIQWEIDRHCWCSVVRETVVDDHYSYFTEKTIRSFMHHVVVVPMGINSVNDLEKLGFWFPHDIFDYSYQDEPLFAKRIELLVGSLKSILQKHTYQNLQDFYIENYRNFKHNSNLVYEHVKGAKL